MMNRLTKSMPMFMAAALVCGMVLAPGCEKKKPPPPPPPPAEIPPPPDVSFDSIMQTLKADPRVKSSPNLSGITDESFARAAVLFADAFARADADKVKGMMSNRAKGVVDGMVNDGTWADLAPRIEEVRIVYAGARSAVGDNERAQGIAQMKAAQAGQLRAFEDQLIKKGIDKNEMARFMAEFQLRLDAALAAAQFEGAQRNAGEATPPPSPEVASDSPDMALLIAIQTPNGAELLGWTGRKGGENWVFNNASTLGIPRGKAADWDGVGMFGFSLGTGKAPVAPKPVRATEEKKPSNDLTPAPVRQDSPSPSPDKPGEQRPPRDPRKLVPGNGG